MTTTKNYNRLLTHSQARWFAHQLELKPLSKNARLGKEDKLLCLLSNRRVQRPYNAIVVTNPEFIEDEYRRKTSWKEILRTKRFPEKQFRIEITNASHIQRYCLVRRESSDRIALLPFERPYKTQKLHDGNTYVRVLSQEIDPHDLPTIRSDSAYPFASTKDFAFTGLRQPASKPSLLNEKSSHTSLYSKDIRRLINLVETTEIPKETVLSGLTSHYRGE